MPPATVRTRDVTSSAAGSTGNVTVIVSLDRKPVANLTLALRVTEPAMVGGPNATNSASGNATAAAKSDGGETPAPGVLGTLVVAFAVAWARRRR